MDGRKPPDSLSTTFGQIDADAAPIESARERTSIVYFASAEEISEGFAIALRAMGFEADILPSAIGQPDTNSNPEDS
jgi:hypothetical protein